MLIGRLLSWAHMFKGLDNAQERERERDRQRETERDRERQREREQDKPVCIYVAMNKFHDLSGPVVHKDRSVL